MAAGWPKRALQQPLPRTRASRLRGPGSASPLLSGNVKALGNMSDATAKYSKWIVRVLGSPSQQITAPGSAGNTDGSGIICRLEHMAELSRDEAAALATSLVAECEAAFANQDATRARDINTSASVVSQASAGCSEERERKVRRVSSEPGEPLTDAPAVAQLNTPAE